MRLRLRSTVVLAGVPVLAIVLAACGSSNNNSTSSTAAAANTSASGGTVSVKSVSGMGDVLVDAQGNTLYTNNQDSASKIACTGQCVTIWPPLAAPSSGQPTSGDSAVQAKLGVVKSGGTSQVTFDGKPLYTFVQDSPGQAMGNGVTDSFAGTSFTWTAASPGGGSGGSSAGATSSGAGTTSTTGSSSGGGGGYGY